LNYPLLVFLIAFFLLWFSAQLGARLGRHHLPEDVRPDFGLILAAVLTLLGLIIGFSFSMATGRYDLRKAYEEAEANAIGTEYVRAALLPETERAQVRDLLKKYTDLRIQFYETRRWDRLQQINADTAQLQSQLWVAVSATANSNPTVIRALAVSGMNDVLNSQGYTQAAWWNRIPVAAWCLMFAIALFCNLLVGYGARKMEPKLFMILPVVVAVAFFLIADIDSPRGGLIRVVPQNLYSLQQGLN
jgi:hypothetical protein